VGRKKNVRTGLQNRLHNTVIPAGQTFSFNTVLNNMRGEQWEQALGIFDGWRLEMIPGGGICQVATTMYRGALDAGFPILARKNHSLFVHYYEKYGVGLDATIFPHAQDMVFQNDTGHPIVIQAYTDGEEAWVRVYGTPDGRKVSMEGPYFQTTAPGDMTLKKNDIGWRRTITYADGRVESQVIRSSYNSLPRGIALQYPSLTTALR
jgi:vancomycin resistance protein YoaR